MRNHERTLAAFLAVTVLTASPAAALAQGARSTAPKIDCTCRHQGRDYHLGEVICLSTPNGMREARCEMALNNTSWKITDGPCPTARAPDKALLTAELPP